MNIEVKPEKNKQVDIEIIVDDFIAVSYTHLRAHET